MWLRNNRCTAIEPRYGIGGDVARIHRVGIVAAAGAPVDLVGSDFRLGAGVPGQRDLGGMGSIRNTEKHYHRYQGQQR